MIKTRNYMIFVICLFSVFCINSAAFGDLGWHMIFENDENGNPLNGDINNLVTAIEKGVDVKVVIINGTYSGSMPVNIVHVNMADPNNPIVGARVTTQIGLQKLSDDSWVHNSNASYVFTIVNTTGVVHYSRYYIDGTKNSETTYQRHIKWYVKY